MASGRRGRALDLLPPALRPRRVTRAQGFTLGLATVTALLLVTALLVPGLREQRHLSRINAEITRLDPQVRAVERVVRDLERKRKLVGTITGLENGALRPLPVLRDLTDLLPTDTWLTTVSFDQKGVELTGQAAAASALIPLLENSPRLERVEFASPVTRGRDKEQFRIRAAWEPGGAQALGPAAAPAGGPAVTPPGAIDPALRPPRAPQPAPAVQPPPGQVCPGPGGAAASHGPASARPDHSPADAAAGPARRSTAMIGNLSRRERTIVIVGVVGLVLVVGWLFIVEPLAERSRLNSDLVPSRSQVLARRLDLLARKDGFAKDLETADGRHRAAVRALPDRGLPRRGGLRAAEADQGDGRPGQYRDPERAHPAAGGAWRAARNPRGNRRFRRDPAARGSAGQAGGDAEIVDRTGLTRKSSERQPTQRATRDADRVRVHPARQVEDVIPRKLLVINGLLLLIAGASAAFIVRQLMAPMAMPLASRPRPPAPAATPEETPRNQAGAYTAVAARNLFSPTRTESPPTAPPSPPPPR